MHIKDFCPNNNNKLSKLNINHIILNHHLHHLQHPPQQQIPKISHQLLQQLSQRASHELIIVDDKNANHAVPRYIRQ